MLNVVEYRESGKEYPFYFVTNLTVSKGNVKETVCAGRHRWAIENQGFNTQKKQGYYLEHMYSHDYTAMKNHYYLIQIGHMISQVMEAWKKLWEGINQSREQKHKRLLESLKTAKLKEILSGTQERIQIRFE